MNDPVGHTNVVCPTCGQEVRVEFVATEGASLGGAFHVGLASRYVHDCPGPDGGERRAA